MNKFLKSHTTTISGPISKIDNLTRQVNVFTSNISGPHTVTSHVYQDCGVTEICFIITIEIK